MAHKIKQGRQSFLLWFSDKDRILTPEEQYEAVKNDEERQYQKKIRKEKRDAKRTL